MKKLLLCFSCLILSASLFSTFAQQQKGWVSLFDGKTLNGWKQAVGTGKYNVENNMIVGTTVAGSPNSFLISEKEYGDFILEMDVKLDDTTSNSGIQFRSHFDAQGNKGKGQVYGYQFEEDGSSRKWTGGIYEEGRRGWLYPLTLNPSAQPAFKTGEFNHIRIEAIGHEIKTWVNDQPVAYLIDSVSSRGIIGLQVHAVSSADKAEKKMYWKNIRIQTERLQPKAFPSGLFVVNLLANNLSSYEKQSGWQLLFDGKSSKGWRSANKSSFPEKGWQVKDGLLTVLSSEGKESANGGDIVTADQYSAFDLSFQFKLTPGANSGVKYFVTLKENTSGSAIGLEYQVLDDKEHPDAKMGINGNRTLASLYDLITAQKQQRFYNPPGQWNWGRILVTPDNHVSHWLNGIKVLEYVRGSKDFRDLVAISKYKNFSNFGEADKGHILLQDHGNEVSFKSIKIRVL